MSIEELVKQPSILASIVNSQTELENVGESIELRLELAQRLEALETEASRSRADFILNQNAENFNANREAWGVPNFSEELVTIDDFKNGFLWVFRAHTTSWSDNQYANEWFYTSLEASSVTRYEFWNCDEGPEKVDFILTGNYKSIIEQLLAEHIYEVLISPAFSKEELAEYIDNFSEDDENYSLDEVIEEYISQNPNFSAE
jgi:predicted DNA-binding protein